MQLDDFFETMGSFVAGALTVESVTARIGASPSGSARLGLYPELVRRQRRDVLDHLFVAVRHACRELGSGLWADIASDYARRHPPTAWEPNHFGQAMSEYLADRASEPTLPDYLAELADYEWIRFAAGVSDAGWADGPGLERGMYVRRYEHDVPSYVDRAASSAPRASLGSPTRTPTSVLVCWSITQHRVMTLTPSVEALAVIGRRCRQPIKRALDEGAMSQAEEHLVSLGVLPKEGGR
jgi:hypothetical protein